MNGMKVKERIGTGLYIIAIVLLIIHIYQMEADAEKTIVDSKGMIALAVAGIYQIWLSREKRKLTKRDSK